ncbi:tagaturonate epimerase family protein [Coraliomargarita sp. SDUM461004]|uniref:Tagaturonate/fructuronate epimerase n=1 Tax=Thalassobacterium sedimentorum TaxID=3041258 RepID=A0ABU1AFI3_9BACT|nr:tagaturonate epimerase family protein [Coraliomargarita sp. SDUM461004]MDQ8192873.1 tagaturonate epimerase family protein [Coraliomargarita sp. SDUM461004]
MVIQKYTLGMGDRFAHQGKAQLQSVINGKNAGIDLYPTWNKSFREHSIVKSQPDDLRLEADAAVAALGWTGDFYVDADHIGLKTVDSFLAGSNFYTLDVADFVGETPAAADVDAFIAVNQKYTGSLLIPGIQTPFHVTEADLREVAGKFLVAIKGAKAIYDHIVAAKGTDNFITEVSVDETDLPQTPIDLFLILSMIAAEGIPAQTIAPKFTGRFNKGVDYVGDLVQFEKEFDEDLSVIAYAIKEFGLPKSLKLSVHSGSDKFSIYPIIKKLITKHDVGLHVKTAGTTWLEEVIGLAEADGDALQIAKDVYAGAYRRFDELTAPYATVIDIDKAELPTPEEVHSWDSAKYVNTLRHVQSHPDYNLNFRQLIHVGFKVAAEMKERYTDALKANESVIAKNVTENLFERHILQIFGK